MVGKWISVLAAIGATAAASAALASTNLVQNGDFSSNGGVGELNVNTFATGWTVGPTVDAAPNPFAFIVDSQADSLGFASAYSPPNITIWGPNSGTVYPSTNLGNPGYLGAVNNGWAGLPSPFTYALGVDGGYAAAPVSQTISGLTPGKSYALSFQWAASQFYGYNGDTTQDWQVSLGATTVTTPTFSLASHGFSGWQTYSNTFTASAASETLTFLAQGAPSVPPFLLLTGVDLSPASGAPEPSTWALLMVGFTGIGFASFRSARRKAAAVS